MTDPRAPRQPHGADPLSARPGSPYDNTVMRPGAPQGARLERGTVIEVDARRHAYRVHLNSGRTIVCGRMTTSRGDTSLLDLRDVVAVSFDLGTPYIVGLLPPETAHVDATTSLTGTDGHGGGDPALDARMGVSNQSGDTPADLLPGDLAIRAPGGAFVGALRGGVASVVGGALASIHAFGAEDAVRINAGTLKLETWLGTLSITNEEGRPNLSLRAGTDQRTHTGADEGRFPIRLDLGSEGDVLRFELTNREGQPLFRLHVSPAGRVEMYAAGGIAVDEGDGRHIAEDVHHGSAMRRITGDDRHQVGGEAVTDIEGPWRMSCGGAANISSGRRISLTAVDAITLQSTGGVDFTGARGVRVNPGSQKFSVNTVLPNGIELGGTAYHGARAEKIVQAINALTDRVNEVSRAVALHTHPGPSPSPSLSQYAVRWILDTSQITAPGVTLG